MQSYIKKAVDKLIDWAVPAFCAALVLLWKDIPKDIQHYWPILLVGLISVCDTLATWRNRKEIRAMRAIHAAADAREAAKQAHDDAIAKAFRAMLDENMANLYAACVAKGYTTEDDRRRYNRLHNAYIGMDGNGEAARRKIHFDALPDEETWHALHDEKEV